MADEKKSARELAWEKYRREMGPEVEYVRAVFDAGWDARKIAELRASGKMVNFTHPLADTTPGASNYAKQEAAAHAAMNKWIKDWEAQPHAPGCHRVQDEFVCAADCPSGTSLQESIHGLRTDRLKEG